MFRRMLEDDEQFGAWSMLDATRIVFFTCRLFRHKLAAEWFRRLGRIERSDWSHELHSSYFAKAFSLTMSRLSFCVDCRHLTLLRQNGGRTATLLQSIVVEQFRWMRETDCIVSFDAQRHLSFLEHIVGLDTESIDSNVLFVVSRGSNTTTLVRIVCKRTTRAGTYTRVHSCNVEHQSAYLRAPLEAAGAFRVCIRLDLLQSALRVFDIGRLANVRREDLICTAHGANTSWPNHLLLKFDCTGTLVVLVNGGDLSTKVSFLPVPLSTVVNATGSSGNKEKSASSGSGERVDTSDVQAPVKRLLAQQCMRQPTTGKRKRTDVERCANLVEQ